MSNYNIGVGKKKITFAEKGIGFQGYMDNSQNTKKYKKEKNIEFEIYSRAFIVQEKEKKSVVIVIADLWSCTPNIKLKVIKRLKYKYFLGKYYNENNVQISGTHSHSGAGGYSRHIMYSIGNFHNKRNGKTRRNVEKIVNGITLSIVQAHKSLSEGKVSIYSGTNNVLEECGNNRSMEAYLNNFDKKEQKNIDPKSATDNEMLLLKFEKNNNAIGMINWFPVHPTNKGQKNHLIGGDNKGWAAKLFEKEMEKSIKNGDEFVAAFANSNCGDVSGNIVYGSAPKGDEGKYNDTFRMKEQGDLQFKKALEIFNELKNYIDITGSIEYQYKANQDMTRIRIDEKRRTWNPAIGFSTIVGSEEDGTTLVSIFFDEGLAKNSMTKDQYSWYKLIKTAQPLYLHLLRTKTKNKFDKPSNKENRGHGEKPIAFFTRNKIDNFLPFEVPLQVLKIGNFISLGIPAELTTMAGRKLRDAILLEYGASKGFNHLALSTYSNAYAQYITTHKEYDMQHYEGASTLYGPHTLAAYKKVFRDLVSKFPNRQQLLA